MDLSQVKVLVVGDVILDKYLIGTTNRISPEAPVPVVKEQEVRYCLGGAGNVAANISSVGANVTLMGCIGLDPAGEEVSVLCEEKQIEWSLISSQSRTTTEKTRVVSDGQQIVRFDRESIQKADLSYCDFNGYDVIIVSDYAKGVITTELMVYLSSLDVPIILDPKPYNPFLLGYLYEDLYLITPNEKEAEQINTTSCLAKNVLTTLGKRGMKLAGEHGSWQFSSQAQEVFDVTGAGDTVVSIIGVLTAMGVNLVESCKTANAAAGIVVSQHGPATLSKDQFLDLLGEIE